MITQIATAAHLSWSQVSAYTQCPAKWWLSRHFPMEMTPAALKFGQAIHEALASFYLSKAEGCSLGADELLATYEAVWSRPSEAELKFNHGEDDQTLREMAERMLTAFLEAVSPGEVLAVEQGFSVEIAEGLLISGFVDLVEIKEGRFWIVDFKTAIMIGVYCVAMGFLMQLLVKLISVLAFYHSRTLEYDADEIGARLTSPRLMANALVKMHGLSANLPSTGRAFLPQAEKWQLQPLGAEWVERLFDTHPPLEKRVERLLAMEQSNGQRTY